MLATTLRLSASSALHGDRILNTYRELKPLDPMFVSLLGFRLKADRSYERGEYFTAADDQLPQFVAEHVSLEVSIVFPAELHAAVVAALNKTWVLSEEDMTYDIVDLVDDVEFNVVMSVNTNKLSSVEDILSRGHIAFEAYWTPNSN